ncbi:hypothetical protein Ahy_B05g079549 isoform C [Arachis hypogaea]|uniref:Uncharacterized protein n=1 Tax=Arachis hypogaea TaxID=3818 RepID=A0A444ZA55_ARAHY|nr:hypothetical protein Ahy_B05g079549 isoform C [Arachis hypogaea]
MMIMMRGNLRVEKQGVYTRHDKVMMQDVIHRWNSIPYPHKLYPTPYFVLPHHPVPTATN